MAATYMGLGKRIQSFPDSDYCFDYLSISDWHISSNVDFILLYLIRNYNTSTSSYCDVRINCVLRVSNPIMFMCSHCH